MINTEKKKSSRTDFDDEVQYSEDLKFWDECEMIKEATNKFDQILFGGDVGPIPEDPVLEEKLAFVCLKVLATVRTPKFCWIRKTYRPPCPSEYPHKWLGRCTKTLNPFGAHVKIANLDCPYGEKERGVWGRCIIQNPAGTCKRITMDRCGPLACAKKHETMH